MRHDPLVHALWLLQHHSPEVAPFKALSAKPQAHRVALIHTLSKLGANFRGVDEKGLAALHHASSTGDVAAVRALLEAGADEDARCAQQGGKTPLIMACEGGHVGVVQALVQGGALVQQSDEAGRSPLHTACALGQAECVRILLAAGAWCWALDNNQETPLQVARAAGHEASVEVMVAAGADS